jgi:uncharacterized protein YecE (DUF72 family)
MRKINWRIGCSGFHYKEWKGIFYPETLPQKNWFQYYSQHFNTLELNTTFYRFPILKSLENWYNSSPAEFLFAVKVPRLITHYKKFNDCKRLIDDFYNLVTKGLKEKLGPVLFQLPPNFTYTSERLELIIKSVYKEYNNVIEFRHESWWKQKVFTQLRKENITFCGIDYPDLNNSAIVTNKLAYYRFHGRPKLYYSQHKICDLKIVADTLLGNKKVSEAFVYFNNTATKAAIRNARWLKRYIKSLD